MIGGTAIRRPSLLTFEPGGRASKMTHYLFRYPAKFHPPVVAELLARYTDVGDVVLDPFVGSGTLLVEACLAGRRSFGVDIDPLAILIAKAKTRRYDLGAVETAVEKLLSDVAQIERSPSCYEAFMWRDISRQELEHFVSAEGLKVPKIPNIEHWFRRYVIVDLARISFCIQDLCTDDRTKLFLNSVFASIIRNCSNADPVPVSGLEYTAHMKRRDASGREVNPFALLRQAAGKAVTAVNEWSLAIPDGVPEPEAFVGSALNFPDSLPRTVTAVITSPPYHNAVDYYRRHQLEMFWLGLTATQEDRLAILPGYIGRPRVPLSNPLFRDQWSPSPLADSWERKIRADSPVRANDFRHYVIAMARVFGQLSSWLPSGAPAVFVVGHSQWNGQPIPTDRLFAEVASPNFTLDEVLYYPVKNRYMSYARRNLASIDSERVLVLRRQTEGSE